MLPMHGSISGLATNQLNDADTSVTSASRPGSTSDVKPAEGSRQSSSTPGQLLSNI